MPDITSLIAFENGELDQEETVALIQDGIDKGWISSLQGFYGRAAVALIDLGLCHN